MNAPITPTNPWKPIRPRGREALLRIALITSVLLPLSWAINALLVGNWDLLGNRDAESLRHLLEWTASWILAVAVVFWLSLLPRFHWFFNRRNARRLVIALVSIVTLAALFYAEENWRGARTWNKYREQLEARGVQLDLAAFTPKPVPDEQNFAATPFVQRWFTERTNAHQWTDDAYSQVATKVADGTNEKSNRFFIDLAAWKMALDAARSGQTNSGEEFKSAKFDSQSRAEAATAVIEMLKDDEAFFAELRAASQRPHSRYPVFYDMENPWGILLPHLASIKHVSERLRLKACAELAAGRSDDALQDVNLIFALIDSLKEEPFLISYLVRILCLHLATQPVWEGLAEHRWTDAQLQELQTRFQRFDFVADIKRPLDTERAAGAMTADIVRKKGLSLLTELMGPGQPSSLDKKFANWCGGFIPRGWYYLEQVNGCRLYGIQLEGAFDPATRRISPGRTEANRKELEREFSGGTFGNTASSFLRHRFLARLLLPALGRIPLKGAKGQVAADHAALACALERYRLANGNFPETLGALAPQFISKLPTDPLTGEPYKYHRTDDGKFVLYSVGWNEKDDGGTVGKTVFDEKVGDWVWGYPNKLSIREIFGF